MSQHVAEVVPVKLEKHPNADSLSIVKVGAGFQCVVNTSQWQGIEKAVYILPDTIVDVQRPEFSFLNRGREKERIKCVRLRGEFSQGLLIPVENSAIIGENRWDSLNLEWYEPELHLSTTGDFAAAPNNWGRLSKYDVENCRRSDVSRMFQTNEEVVAMIKLNGSNTSFVFTDGQMYVRSRSGFRKNEEGCLFWRSLRSNPDIEKYCRNNPDILLYGETVGNVKNFKYGCGSNEVKFYVFDIMNNDRKYLDVDELRKECESNNLPLAPIVYRGPFDMATLLSVAELPCPLNNKISEGIVIRPIKERRCGNERVIAKIVSNQYLMS